MGFRGEVFGLQQAKACLAQPMASKDRLFQCQAGREAESDPQRRCLGLRKLRMLGASVLERSGLDWQLDAGLRLLQFSSQQAFNPSSPIKAHTSGTRKPKSLMCHARMPLLMTGPTLTFRRDRSRGSRGTQLQLPRAFRQPKSKQKCRSACQSLARSFGEPTFYCGWGVQIRIQRARPRPG